MEDLIEAWGEGKLPEEVFDEIIATIISKRSEIKLKFFHQVLT